MGKVAVLDVRIMIEQGLSSNQRTSTVTEQVCFLLEGKASLESCLKSQKVGVGQPVTNRDP